MVSSFLSTLDAALSPKVSARATAQPVFRRGDPVRFLYVVAKGRVRLSRTLIGGSEITLARVEAGELLAEASVYSPRYHCDATTETACHLKKYPMRDVATLLGRDAQFAEAYGAYLANQLMSLRAAVEIKSFRRAEDRLFAWLCMQAKGNPPCFSGRGLWPSIALQIGLTPESMYRALARLERRRKIERVNGDVTIRSSSS